MASPTAICELAGSRRRHSRPLAQTGYTYLIILVLLAVMSMASALTLEVAQTNAQRSSETELLAIGKEFERAFASYYRQSPFGGPRYPMRLEDLTRDPRFPGVRRHLRRLYVDPLSGSDWGAVAAPGGGIMGIYSTAAGRPYREYSSSMAILNPVATGASAPLAAQTYADWRFGFDPARDLPARMRIITPTPATVAPAP